MATLPRVLVLLWVQILVTYTMWITMAYLTNVWKVGFTLAAAIVNVFWGLADLLPLLQAFLVDSITGDYWMLLISTIALSTGLGLLTMSTPPLLAHVTDTCSGYMPECIGESQKLIFYTALLLMAFGFAGHVTSYSRFLADQIAQQPQGEQAVDGCTFCKFFCSISSVGIFYIVAIFGLPYIKPWSLRYGIPAICYLVATLLFLSGSRSYVCTRPQGSLLTIYFRVFVAALSKLFHAIPTDPNQLFESSNSQLYLRTHTKSLRCLDKAAIVVPTIPVEEQCKSNWGGLCRVTEVEETKTILRMIPVRMTFILCGIVSSIGFTFFVEQLNRMNPKVGRLKVPTLVFLWFLEQSQEKFQEYYNYATFTNLLGERFRKYSASVGIVISMIFAILCCITAAKVENRRLGVVQKHGLMADETVPMTMFWLLPQFILLGAFDGIFRSSVVKFFHKDESPALRRRYLRFFRYGVSGIGILGSIVSVYVVGKISERGGKMNWFQHDLNRSRLDKYYWTLAWLMAINLVVFMVVAMFYRYNESKLEEQQANDAYDDDSKCFCCC